IRRIFPGNHRPPDCGSRGTWLEPLESIDQAAFSWNRIHMSQSARDPSFVIFGRGAYDSRSEVTTWALGSDRDRADLFALHIYRPTIADPEMTNEGERPSEKSGRRPFWVRSGAWKPLLPPLATSRICPMRS